LNPGPLAPKADALPADALHGGCQLRISIVVKPFNHVNCFDAMGRNVNKQSQICGPDIFQQVHIFCNILHA